MQKKTYTAGEIHAELDTQGDLPVVARISGGGMAINAICKHGKGSMFNIYRMLRANRWRYISDEHPIECPVCDGNSSVVCEICRKELPAPSDDERIEYYTKGIDVFTDTCCPDCGSLWVVEKEEV
ncbi:MAG: hypothetical protein MRJ65_03980 [Candidatus Brocadiaceae bacterium]|nr:hypothetical protein [Candidatus Brocadiaceae bacterium]